MRSFRYLLQRAREYAASAIVAGQTWANFSPTYTSMRPRDTKPSQCRNPHAARHASPRTRIAGIAAILVCAGLPNVVSAQPVTVFAAASLTDVFKDIDVLWRQGGHAGLRLNFAASSMLARQIEQGARANIFASADEQWMDYAQQHGLIVPETRRVVAANVLVLVMDRLRARTVNIVPGFDLLSLLGQDGRVAVGDPTNVPAGIYAQQALTRLGLWDMVRSRLAPADSVRSAMLLVERGEAPLGIVYSTDAKVSPGLATAGIFPDSSHDPIVYPFAVTRAGDTKDARTLLDFLGEPPAQAAFASRGFAHPPR